MKKILYVTDNNVNTTGGEQESTKILVSEAATRYQVELAQPGVQSCATTNQPQRIYSLGKHDRVKQLFRNPLQIPCYLVRLYKTVKHSEADVVHSQSQVAFFSLGLLKRLGFIPKQVRLIHTDRSIFSKYNNFYLRIFRFCLPAFDTLVVTTDLNHSLWSSYLTQQKVSQQLKVIYNTPGSLFEQDAPTDAVDSNSNGLTIGFAGRYCDWKNWPLAEDIIAEVESRSASEFHYSMAVGCLDNEAAQATKYMFSQLGQSLGERFDGKVNLPLTAMTEFYHNIDVLVVTSDAGAESFGRTVVEAMATGCVVLTTDCGGPTEIIRDDELVKTTSSEFADEIIKLNQDRMLMNAIKTRNKTIVQQHYTSRANAIKHFELYQQVLNYAV